MLFKLFATNVVFFLQILLLLLIIHLFIIYFAYFRYGLYYYAFIIIYCYSSYIKQSLVKTNKIKKDNKFNKIIFHYR